MGDLKKFLVVSNDSEVRTSLPIQLYECGYDLWASVSMSEAMAWEDMKPYGILVDIETVEIEQALHLGERLNKPPICLMRQVEPDIFRYLDRIGGYLLKPVRLNSLRLTLELAGFHIDQKDEIRDLERLIEKLSAELEIVDRRLGIEVTPREQIYDHSERELEYLVKILADELETMDQWLCVEALKHR